MNMVVSEEDREELRKTAESFLEAIQDEIDSCVFLGDIDRLDGLVQQVKIYLDHRLVHDLREKGLEENIRELCDKAGTLGKQKTV